MSNKNFPGGRRNAPTTIKWRDEHKEYPERYKPIQLQPEDVKCLTCMKTLNLCKCAELERSQLAARQNPESVPDENQTKQG